MNVAPEIMEKARILVVDDGDIGRKLLQRNLETLGYRHIGICADGREAVERFAAGPFDLVLLDLLMPVMDGFACCQMLRQMPQGSDVPILVLTSLTDPQERARAFRNGATDFINKPIHLDELRARVGLHLTERFSRRLLESFHVRVVQELDTARSAQRALLPDARTIERLAETHAIALSCRYTPSSELGGDGWGIRTLDGDRVAVWIVDFAGHGVAAALNVFHLHGLLGHDLFAELDPAQVLGDLNEKLCAHLPTGQFATFFIGVIDRKRDTLEWAAAGSPTPLIRRRNGYVEILDSTGLPLGIAPHRYAIRRTPFRAGDVILLYSDDMDQGSFGEDPVVGIAEWLAGQHGDIAELITCLAERHLPENAAPADDLTLVALKRLEAGQ